MVYRKLTEIASRAEAGGMARRLAIAAAADERVLDAAVRAQAGGLVHPLLVGEESLIRELLARAGADWQSFEIIGAKSPEEAARRAVELARQGEADFLMKGNLNTSTILKAVLNKEWGLGSQDSVLSNMCVMEIPAYHKLLTFTDGAILIQPNLEQKKQVVQNTVNALRAMGYEKPKVAVLSAIESANPKMPETMDAEALRQMYLNGELRNCVVDGPVAIDLAVDKASADCKGYRGPIAGEADLILVHNIVVGNALAKSLRLFAGAESVGMVIGAGVPIVLTSRSATTESKYLSILTAAAATQGRHTPGRAKVV